MRGSQCSLFFSIKQGMDKGHDLDFGCPHQLLAAGPSSASASHPFSVRSQIFPRQIWHYTNGYQWPCWFTIQTSMGGTSLISLYTQMRARLTQVLRDMGRARSMENGARNRHGGWNWSRCSLGRARAMALPEPSMAITSVTFSQKGKVGASKWEGVWFLHLCNHGLGTQEGVRIYPSYVA